MADRETGVFTRPEAVKRVPQEGPNYNLDAIHLAEPSPQRTSRAPPGRHLACWPHLRGAECRMRLRVGPFDQAHCAMRAAPRDPETVLIFAMMTLIAALIEAEAMLVDYRRYADPVGALTLMSGWTGVDFSALDLDSVVQHVENDAG